MSAARSSVEGPVATASPSEGVRLIRLNRPEALNALNQQLLRDLMQAFDDAGRDERIRCVVLTGSDRAFAAGADIPEMASRSYSRNLTDDFLADVARRLEQFRKPVIAAVAGYALGGGCELAMLCDLVIAADTAKFGQPEINLGIMPGLGGTQRLPRAAGKSKAMDLVLSARMMDAYEAERAGLVSRIAPADRLLDEALAVARTIAAQPPLAMLMIKETINAAFETTLATGLRLERRLFQSLFALHQGCDRDAGALTDDAKPNDEVSHGGR